MAESNAKVKEVKGTTPIKSVEKTEPKKETKEVSFKDLIEQVKKEGTGTRGKGLGHIGAARKILRDLKKEIGTEYGNLGPALAFGVVCKVLEKKNPKLLKDVTEQVTLKLYKQEVSQVYYAEKDVK